MARFLVNAVELFKENERLRKAFRSRGLEIIELQHKLSNQGTFYENELQEVEKEKENYRKALLEICCPIGYTKDDIYEKHYQIAYEALHVKIKDG